MMPWLISPDEYFDPDELALAMNALLNASTAR
jgi:hypothetical protein